MKIVPTCCVIVSFIIVANTAQAGWGDWFNKGAEILAEPETANTVQQLTQGEIVGGLKEALIIGSKKAIALLSQQGGYLNDQGVRIPIPENLRFVEKTLRAVGQSGMADEFIATMNHAAEQAVPQAVDIFAETITSMTLQDAQGILTGPDDSATQYFKRAGHERLTAAMLPFVKTATEKVGVTASYKSFVKQAEPYIKGGGRQAQGLLNTFGGSLGQFQGLAEQAGQYAQQSTDFDADAFDVDDYITRKALEGLFFKLAEEEKAIRRNPVARSTALLKKVFGSVGL